MCDPNEALKILSFFSLKCAVKLPVSFDTFSFLVLVLFFFFHFNIMFFTFFILKNNIFLTFFHIFFTFLFLFSFFFVSFSFSFRSSLPLVSRGLWEVPGCPLGGSGIVEVAKREFRKTGFRFELFR